MLLVNCKSRTKLQGRKIKLEVRLAKEKPPNLISGDFLNHFVIMWYGEKITK